MGALLHFGPQSTYPPSIHRLNPDNANDYREGHGVSNELNSASEVALLMLS